MSEGQRLAAKRAVRTAATVVTCQPLGSLVWLTVQVPGWPGATPGRFALLWRESSACFLPRAFSVAQEQGDLVSFLIAPVGPATRELQSLAAGDTIWVTGPLGQGFDLDLLRGTAGEGLQGGRLVVVGGGTGVAPFPLLLERLAHSSVRARTDVLVLLGFRDRLQAEAARPVEAAAGRVVAAGGSCRLEKVTEDNQKGPARLVTDLLAKEIRPSDRLAVCGPNAMARRVWQLCDAVGNIHAWFSLEAIMACGVGSCQGCALTLADGRFARVCRDGPVFAGVDVYGKPNQQGEAC